MNPWSHHLIQRKFQASTESDQRLLELLVVRIYLGIDVAAVRFLGRAKRSQGSNALVVSKKIEKWITVKMDGKKYDDSPFFGTP